MRRDPKARGHPGGRARQVTILTDPIKMSGMLHELLAELDDAGLHQFIGYWKHRYRQYQEAGQGFSAWKSSNILSAGYREASRRGPSERPNDSAMDPIG